ncbi:hypothetical protein DNU06_05360 [Putridiphycobacter roseus]|uniref:Uncharacterized protein n=1 Tax=Putridiphycobacter roseus TaxID=2219161 RepID=A0A2W1N1C7_9FLAO|nr:hypothetical protein [Putridiphycobacter roseus]PZE18047.1 hypothetical protein DNU06_05360 [Putridiphycobacter roseus]
MFGLAIRKKIDEDKLANIFVNSLLEAVENGFGDVAGMINEDLAFQTSPSIDPKAYQQFLLIVITGNLTFLGENNEIDDVEDLSNLIIKKYASIFDMQTSELDVNIQKMRTFISQVNYPSKNYLYGLSKAVFFKYHLNNFQESYFKTMNSPNPLFLKRMDELVQLFLWDWDKFFKKHKMQ